MKLGLVLLFQKIKHEGYAINLNEKKEINTLGLIIN